MSFNGLLLSKEEELSIQISLLALVFDERKYRKVNIMNMLVPCCGEQGTMLELMTKIANKKATNFRRFFIVTYIQEANRDCRSSTRQHGYIYNDAIRFFEKCQNS